MGKIKEQLSNLDTDQLMDAIAARRADYNKKFEELKKKVIGAKIVSVTPMSDETVDSMYGETCGYKTPILITLDSGIEINAQADEENNGPGTFAFFDPKTGAEAFDWDFTNMK